MNKINVTVDNDTYRLLRIRAANEEKSVSALVRGLLKDLVDCSPFQGRFESLSKLQDETLEEIRYQAGGLRSADNLSPAELYKRDALR